MAQIKVQGCPISKGHLLAGHEAHLSRQCVFGFFTSFNWRMTQHSPCTLICAIKSPAKSYGYFHVGKFRLLPVSGALRLSYGKNEVVSVFSDHLQDIMNEAMIKGPDAEAEEDLMYGKESWKYDFLVEKSRRHVGKLFRSGLEQMTWIRSSSCTHQHPSRCELVTLSMALDLLMEQKFAELGDLLMQRMKAVEVSLTEGWSVANHQELIPGPKASLTTDQERSFAARQAVQKKKLQEVVGHKKKTG